MLNHLASTLTTIEGEFIDCGILLSSDLNRLIKCITTQFRLKQPVNKPTRGERILDLVLTNLPHMHLCDKNSAQTLPFGLSDHNVVFLRPKTRPGKRGRLKKTADIAP